MTGSALPRERGVRASGLSGCGRDRFRAGPLPPAGAAGLLQQGDHAVTGSAPAGAVPGDRGARRGRERIGHADLDDAVGVDVDVATAGVVGVGGPEEGHEVEAARPTHQEAPEPRTCMPHCGTEDAAGEGQGPRGGRSSKRLRTMLEIPTWTPRAPKRLAYPTEADVEKIRATADRARSAIGAGDAAADTRLREQHEAMRSLAERVKKMRMPGPTPGTWKTGGPGEITRAADADGGG